MEREFDLIVIGAGPGGYVAAIKAAKLGMRVAVLENREPGGTCLNRGCIPAKAMLHASGLYREMKEAERFGIFAENVSFDYGKILAYKEATSAQLREGVAQLIKANGAELIYGTGTIVSKGVVKAVTKDGEELLKAKNILIATGSRPLRLPIPGIELPGVVTSDELFQLTEAPERLLIIGGGVIGVEFATVFSALGTKVTIVEALPRILANLDKDFAQNLKLILKKRGVEIVTGARVKSLSAAETGGAGGLVCTFEEKEEEKQVSAQYVLSAVGRVPETAGLFGEGFSLSMERGRILVDENYQTSEEGIYAIGDVTGGIQLAHAASAQGVVVAESLAGHMPSVRTDLVPSCVYTEPEIASIGINEGEAKEQGIEVSCGKFMMGANGKSLISKEERGFIKVIADAKTGRVLGAQMMCARATDMIGEFGTAIANELTVGDMLLAMRAHPTYNEAVGEALEELAGGSIHSMPRKK
ncbi:MAG: dihydrolipoyl dehydrogenase [Eubacteriales bacterium]|nr:dihydrolipoyl dehydrogenase [Eubacteriales bacterium]